MSNERKYRIAQVVFGLAFPVTGFCLLQIFAAGLVDTGRMKLWFVLLIITVVIGVAFGLAFYYFRSRRSEIDTGSVAVHALAATADTQKPAAPERPQKTRQPE